MNLLSIAFFTCTIVQGVKSLDNGLGLVPPMGWNPWNVFNCNITEQDILTTADRMVELGLKDAGYVYVNLDDCWMAPERTPDGKYTNDPVKFPSGMESMGHQLHTRGFHFGIYTSAGSHTCAGLPGSLGHEEVDAQTFADWGVDYLKYDNCPNGQPTPNIVRYTAMRDALNATGRPIFYSLCNWGQDNSWRWAPAVGNSWRTTDDIWAQYRGVHKNFWESQAHAFRSQPGAWLDPDMLEVGHPHLTFEQSKTHFSLWVLAKAPLLLGMDLTGDVSKEILDLIRHKELVSFHQDPATQQAQCFVGCSAADDFSILASKWHADETIAIVVNWSETVSNVTSWSAPFVGVVAGPHEVLAVTDLFTQVTSEHTFETSQTIPLELGPYESAVYVIRSASRHESVNRNSPLAVTARSRAD